MNLGSTGPGRGQMPGSYDRMQPRNCMSERYRNSLIFTASGTVFFASQVGA